MWVEVTLFCVTTTLYLILRWKSAPRNLPPGPRGLPLLGNLWALWRWRGGGSQFYMALHKMSQKFGPVYSFRFEGRDIVVLSGSKVVSEWKSWLLEHPNYLRSIPEYISPSPPRPDDPLTPRGHLETSLLDPILLELLSRIRREMGDGVHLVAHSHTLFHPSILTALWVLGTSGPLGSTPSRFPLLEKELEIIEMLKPILAPVDQGQGQGGRGQGQGGRGQGQELSDLLDKCRMKNLDMFQKLSETLFQGTWASVAWAVLFLILHPQVQEKMVQEIEGQLKEEVEGPLKGPLGVVGLKDKTKLRYCFAVILEVQRLANVRPLITPPIRIIGQGQGDLKLGGYTIPRKTGVIVDLYSLHRSRAMGPNPDQFCPERFLGPTPPELVQYLDFNPVHLDGNEGSIPVQDLVSDALFKIVVTLVRHFSLATVTGHLDPGTEPEPSPGPILTPKPFNFIIRRR